MTPEKIQADYYAKTAGSYNRAHEASDSHREALDLIVDLAKRQHWDSFLDVGAGTGRGVSHLRACGLKALGIEPVAELIAQSPSSVWILRGSGINLPYADRSFDCVFSLGILHHVARPDVVIAEMCRVARYAVVVSDSNRFGQGSPFVRRLKYALWRCGLWPAVQWIVTRGKGYHFTEGDGVFWSYSLWDNERQLRNWGGLEFRYGKFAAENEICVSRRHRGPHI